MTFKDRVEAGKKLAEALSEYQGKDAIVYAIPRGGVILGVEIAKTLKLPLELVLIRKIGHPMNPEYAICAASESGHVLCSEEGVEGISQGWLDEKIYESRQEILRRHQAYLPHHPPLPTDGHISIIVDDGIATGITIMAAIHELQNLGASKTIVAVPIAPPEVAKELKTQADEVVILDTPSDFAGSVGAYYENFPQVSDEEVIQLLREI